MTKSDNLTRREKLKIATKALEWFAKNSTYAHRVNMQKVAEEYLEKIK